jgi:hypothetical protein
MGVCGVIGARAGHAAFCGMTMNNTISFDNGIQIELLTAGGVFRGLGSIRAGGVALRAGRRPMFVELRTPDAVEMFDFALERRAADGGGVTLEFSMKARSAGIMEYMVHEVRPRYRTGDWSEEPAVAPDTRLALELKPVTRIIGGTTFVGFSYRYRYNSRPHPMYKILDRSTWEIGGHAVGNEFWMRNCFSPSIVPIKSTEQFHSTEWFLPTATNPNIFQFLPLQTELQGFTFTTGPQGTLVTWATEIAHVRSLFEKERGKDEITHWHEHCGDLSSDFATSPMEVLFAPGNLDRVGRINLYDAVKELVHDTLHAQANLKRERVTTYGQIEEWVLPDFKRYTELGLPKLLEFGCKTIGLANHFENNMNTYGVSNFCCTLDYRVSENVGEESLQRFCQLARQHGAKVEMWGNTSISSLTYILSMRNEGGKRIDFLPIEGSIMEALRGRTHAFCRNASNAIEADHYTPVFCVLNLRDPGVREYWMNRWRDAATRIGLGGIFLDSSFNLSSDKFHWVQSAEAERLGATADQVHLLGSYRPAQEPRAMILSQYKAHLQLMSEMQQAGYQYCNEDLGVFGIHRHGPGTQMRLECLFMWDDCICNFDPAALEKAGDDPDDVFFRGLAYRMMWAICWDIKRDALSFHYGGLRGDSDRPEEKHKRLYQAFNEVTDLMHHRQVLPDEAGVLYRKDGKQVLWAFRDFVHPLPEPAGVRDVLAGTTQKTASLKAQKHRIYVIG